ncbi:chromate transporter-domain-containing protein [Chaetomium strumarium]|uniref:Chromate transporter-domain-containing protein n=1 Tax=Chaetomium strumarium TaxID=1170767 RepID=A0AAJ0H173_9PEZI|nr:chromate transporter-domain-containing protein [Chaetomium strumarium]
MGVRDRWSPPSLTWDSISQWKVTQRLWNTVRETWYLGFTSFGGPPVHFKIFHDKFVNKVQWIDEQVYQELFSVCQAFSGPGSTKMLYCINLIHDGFLAAVLGFLIWSLPAGLGMFGLAVGVSNIGETLPRAVYALLSGLNAATVGIIALAAVQLAQKAITDKLTRLLVFLGAAAGLLYNALWYFPLLMMVAGIITVIYDFRWLHGPVRWVVRLLKKARGRGNRVGRDEPEAQQQREGDGEEEEEVELSHRPASTTSTSEPPTSARPQSSKSTRQRLPLTTQDTATTTTTNNRVREQEEAAPPASPSDQQRTVPASHQLEAPHLTWKWGLTIIALFLASFTAIMIARGLLSRNDAGNTEQQSQSVFLYRVFANFYLAGTIIFGGGPVVIPLLREYIVAEGWVSPRDFLIGLALVQGFPGPNFNFAVYLGALAASGRGASPALGAVLGYVGMFAPGLVTVHGTVGVWGAIRGWRWVRSALRGINAAAVGLIYTAVYRLWQIGWIDEGFQRGTSLADDPWWVVVTASSYVGGCWFGVSPPVAIVLGAALGLVRYGVVG